ncbi:hypothetical protein [Streptomyces sp. NPDC006527]|uniref:hypothetical protein n=1 Tax=Streptomyces sp. NPDC006527 TaxID=3364749 RepID=UPI0036B2580A
MTAPPFTPLENWVVTNSRTVFNGRSAQSTLGRSGSTHGSVTSGKAVGVLLDRLGKLGGAWRDALLVALRRGEREPALHLDDLPRYRDAKEATKALRVHEKKRHGGKTVGGAWYAQTTKAAVEQKQQPSAAVSKVVTDSGMTDALRTGRRLSLRPAHRPAVQPPPTSARQPPRLCPRRQAGGEAAAGGFNMTVYITERGDCFHCPDCGAIVGP